MCSLSPHMNEVKLLPENTVEQLPLFMIPYKQEVLLYDKNTSVQVK